MTSSVWFLLFSLLLAISNANGPPIREIYQFENMTFIENIAVRSNSQLLLTILTEPELRGIYPLDPNPQPSVVHRFPNATGLGGITEVEPDIFAVVTANFSFTAAASNFIVWTVNLRKPTPKVFKSANLPADRSVNGIARLSNKAILGADSNRGVIYRVDLDTGVSSIAIQDETMEAPATRPGMGIDGLRIQGTHAYYDNIGKGLFCRIPINLHTGAATGPVEIISDAVYGIDDFALSKTAQTAYAANFVKDSLMEIAADGEVKVIAGGPDEGVFHAPTSAQFGRTPLDRQVLYVVSSGGKFDETAPSFFNFVEGGKVVGVKVYD